MMTSVLTRSISGLATAGLVALAMSGPVLAGGPTNRDQGTSMFDTAGASGASASTAALAAALQGFAALLSPSTSPATAADLQALRETMRREGPGSPEVAKTVSQVLDRIVTPQIATNPPALNAEQTRVAVTLLNNIVQRLSAQGAAVPPSVLALRSALQARLS